MASDETLSTEQLAAAGEREQSPDLADDLAAMARRDEPRRAEDAEADEPLLPRSDLDGFWARWQEVQTGFVDEPRAAVEQADALVAEVMQRLAQSFSDERSRLEAQWDRGDDVSTEDLRVALTRYRSFFERLLSA